MGCADVADESFAGRAFTVVFIAAIGLDDGFWGQRDDLAHVRMKHDGLQDLVRIAHFAFFAFVGQTARAIDFFGRKVLRAVQSDKIVAAFQLIGQKLFAPLQVAEQNGKARIQQFGINGINGFSQDRVTGDGFNSEHGF